MFNFTYRRAHGTTSAGSPPGPDLHVIFGDMGASHAFSLCASFARRLSVQSGAVAIATVLSSTMVQRLLLMSSLLMSTRDECMYYRLYVRTYVHVCHSTIFFGTRTCTPVTTNWLSGVHYRAALQLGI